MKRGNVPFSHAVGGIGVCAVLLGFAMLALPSPANTLSRQEAGAAGGQGYWTNFFSEALDDCGLDVRDCNNRPVKSAVSRKNLKDIFVLTTVRLIAYDGLPIVSAVRQYLEKMLTPFAEQLRRAKKWLIRTMEVTVWFNLKRFFEMLFLFFLPLTTYHLPLMLLTMIVALRFRETIPTPQNIPMRC